MQLILPSTTVDLALCLVGLMTSMVFDFVVRQKLGGTNLTHGYLKQIAVPLPSSISDHDKLSICRRVLELTFTASDLRSLYIDAIEENHGMDLRTGPDRGEPWQWEPLRRAEIRAELDAIYARLYGLNRDELRYILDPADVMNDDYPSQTFRVLKSKETHVLNEYRTQRLVLDAWDRMEAGQLV